MKRLLATLRVDLQLQARNSLYVIGVVVALGTGLLGRSFLEPAALAVMLPGLWLGAVGGTTFLFVAGMVLFEKNQRTLDAIVVTPLPFATWLASKVVTLTGFAMIESLLVLFVAHGSHRVAWGPLLAGLVLLGALYVLVGVAQVVAHDVITEFLVPGGIVTLTVLQLPVVDAFGLWTHPALYLVPTQPAVVLMKGGFRPLAPWEWAYAVAYGVCGLAGAAWLARRRFERFIMRREHAP